MEGKPIPVYGAGANIRDWLFVEDHVSALFTILERGKIGESYNVGGRNELKNIDLVRLLCKERSTDSPRQPLQTARETITFVTDRPGHDRRYAIDLKMASANWAGPRRERQGRYAPYRCVVSGKSLVVAGDPRERGFAGDRIGLGQGGEAIAGATI